MYDGRNGFGYQPHKVDDRAPPVDVFTGQRLFKPPLAYKIIDPRRWKESDKLWASYYSNLLTEYESERLLRSHYQEMSKNLQKENSFLMDALNRVMNGEEV